MTYRVKTRLCAAIALVLACVLAFTGCSATVSASADLMKGIAPAPVSGKPVDDAFIKAQTAFALKLLQGCATAEKDENMLLSPLSVQMALAMTANGAKGDTLHEMETALGGLPIADLNEYWYTARNAMSDDWHLANSIWFKAAVHQAFLQTNADYYGADAYKAAFDEQTANDINDWVNTHTDGMIDRMVDRLNPMTVMYLVNALVFDGEWETKYAPASLFYSHFTAENGEQSTVKMMASAETTYLKDENAAGFIKPYDGGRYAFAALLPDRGVSLADYVAGLTSERLGRLLATPENGMVTVHLPQFEVEYDVTLNGVLSAMGMPTAFTSAADFSGIGKETMYIGDVVHKTHMEVDEHGTKAGAATSVEIKTMSAGQEQTVVLDRPFVYMIVDTQTHIPAFIGTVTSI